MPQALQRLPASVAGWAVGPTTAAPLAAFAAVRTPAESSGADGLADAMISARPGGAVLHPRGEEVRVEFGARLRAAGHRVDEIIVYRTVLASPEHTATALRDTDIVLIGSHRVLARAAETTSGRRSRATGAERDAACMGRAA